MAREIVNQVEETVNNTVNDTVETSEEQSVGRTFKDICNEIVANGGTRIRGIKVRSCKITEQDNYTMVSLTLERKVKGYRANEDTGIFEEGETNVIFSSSYSLASVLKNNEDLAFCANSLVENPRGFEVVLSGATIDIIQQPVAADEMYKNPFSTRDAEGVALGHDTIINHVVNIVPSRRAMGVLDRMALAMLGL